MTIAPRRPRPGFLPKAVVPPVREACLIGDPSRRGYVHLALVEVGQGVPSRGRAFQVGRQARSCPTR